MPTPAFRQAFPEYQGIDDATLDGLLAQRGIDPRLASVRRLYPQYGEVPDADLLRALDARGVTDVPLPGQAPVADLPDPAVEASVVSEEPGTGSWWDVPARIGARAHELMSGFVSGIPPTAAEAVGRSMPAGVGIPGLGGPEPSTFAPGGEVAPFDAAPYRDVQRELRAGVPEAPPDPFPGLAGVERPGAGDVLEASLAHPASTVGWALRQGLASLPDMGAALASLPAYATALSGLMAEERAEAQGAADPTAADRAIAQVGGVVSAALGRAGASVLFRGLPEPLRARLLGGGQTLPGRLAGDVLGRTGAEAGIEALQSGVEGVARAVGTPEPYGAIPGEMAMGAVGGAGAGAAIGGPAAAVDQLVARPRREQLEAQAEARAVADQVGAEQMAESALAGARAQPDFYGTASGQTWEAGDWGGAPAAPESLQLPGPALEASNDPRAMAAAQAFEAALDQGADPEQAMLAAQEALLAMDAPPVEPEAPPPEEPGSLSNLFDKTPWDPEREYEEAVEEQVRTAEDAGRRAVERGATWQEAQAEYDRVLDEVLGPEEVPLTPEEQARADAEAAGRGPGLELDEEAGARAAALEQAMGGQADDERGREAAPGARPSGVRGGPAPEDGAQPPPRAEAGQRPAPDDRAPGLEGAAGERGRAEGPPAEQPPGPGNVVPIRQPAPAEPPPVREAARPTEPTAPGAAHAPPVEDMEEVPETEAGIRTAARRRGVQWRMARRERGQEVHTPDGKHSTRVWYGVVDAGSIKASFGGTRHDPGYDETKQPRDRGRAASDLQIAGIGAKPEFDLAGESASSAEGAPLVDPSMDVISGNARTFGLRRAYSKGTAGAYRKKLGEWAKRRGLDLSGMERPILVRMAARPPKGMTWQQFAVAANQSTVLAQSGTERAARDADDVLDDATINQLDPTVDVATDESRRNDAGLRGFAGRLPTTEHGALLGRQGQALPALRQRVAAAVMRRAYGGEDWYGRAEEEGAELAAVREGMRRAAVAVAQARVAGQGEVGERIERAARALMDWRRTPAKDRAPTLAEALRQPRAGEKALDGEEVALAVAMDQAKRSPQKVGDLLAAYAMTRQRDAEGSLFGDPPATVEDIAAQAGEVVRGRHAETEPAAELYRGRAGQGQGQGQPQGQGGTLAREGTVPGPGAQHRPDAETEGLQPGERESGATNLRRRQSIVSSFAKAIGAGVYFRRLYRKGTAGMMHTGTGEVRVRRSGDAETAAHEIAHLIDVRTWGKWAHPHDRSEAALEASRADYLKARPWNARMVAEMESLSYDASLPWEGWAEFVRTYMTQPAHAKAAAPTMTAWMDRWIASKRNPVGKPFREATKELRDWYTASPVEQARTKIGVEPPGAKRRWESEKRDWPDAVRDAAWRARQRTIDDLAGAERMMAETGQRRGGDAFERAQLSRAASSIVEEALRRGPPVREKLPSGDVVTRFGGKGLVEVLKPVVGKDYDDFMLYIVGRSAAELRGQGRENLFSGTQIEAMRKLGEGKPHFARAADDLQAWFRGLTDFAIATGLITEKQRAGWQRDFYVPFYRETASGPAPRERAGEGRIGGETGIRRLRGGEGNLRDISANLVANAQSMIETSLINEARRGLVDAAMKAPESARWLVRLGKRPKLLGQVDTEGIVRSMGAALKQTLGEEAAPALDTLKAWAEAKGKTLEAWAYVNDPQKIPGERLVAVIREGQVEWYEVAPDRPEAQEFFQSLARVKPPARGTFLRNLNRGRRAFQATITLSANFVLRNFWRDTWQAWAHSRAGFKPVWSSMKGAFKVLADSKDYRDYLAAGGMAGSQSTDPDSAREALQAAARRMGAKFPLASIANPMEWVRLVERVNWAFEAAARVEEFSLMRKRGAKEASAAYAARDFANYSLRGDLAILNLAKDNIPFLSAGWVGLDKAWRGLTREQKGKVLTAYAARIGYYGLVGTGIYALGRHNPLIVEAEDWEKDAYLLVPVPKPKRLAEYARGDAKPTEQLSQLEAGERYELLRIPKSWEMGSVMSVGQRMVDAAMTGKWGDELRHVPSILASNFRFDWAPWYVRPVLEAGKPWGERGGGTNVHAFTGRPIEGVGMERLPPGMRAGPSTSPPMVALGRATLDLPFGAQISPARADHIGRGFLNAFWTAGMAIATQAFYRDESRAVDWRRVPLVSVGVRAAPGRTRRDAEFYEWYREALVASAAFDKMSRSTRPPKDTTLARYAGKAAMTPQLRQIGRQLSNIRKSRRQIAEHPTLTRRQKQERDWELARRYNDLMVQVTTNPALREAVGARP